MKTPPNQCGANNVFSSFTTLPVNPLKRINGGETHPAQHQLRVQLEEDEKRRKKFIAENAELKREIQLVRSTKLFL
jgi:hypothetical protein